MKSTITNHEIWMLSSAIQDLTYVSQEIYRDHEEWKQSAIEAIKKALYALENDEIKL